MRISDWSSDVCSSDLLGSIATLIADPVLVLLHDLCKLIFQCLGNGFLFEIVESDFLRSILRHGGCPGLADEVSQRRLARREDANLARRQRHDLLHQDRKSTRLNSSHYAAARLPSPAYKRK